MDVRLHFLRGEAQLPDRHADHALLLAVLVGPDHAPDRLLHVPHDRPQFRARHQPLGPQDAAHRRLVQLLAAVAVAQEPVEEDLAAFDARDQIVLADVRGPGFARGGRGGVVGGADEGDAEVGFDGVGELEPVADHGAVAN